MKLESLENTKHKDYAKELYEKSFPEDERRDFCINFELIKEKNFDFFIITNSSNNFKPIGIISIWYFKHYIYIEHFAIDRNKRLKGYGRNIIKTIIETIKLPIIIEVEPPNNDISKKRVEFYTRLEFILLDHPYLQPPYSKERNSIRLNLMIYNNNLLAIKPIDKIIEEIHNVVYSINY